jgi:zinc protease
MNKLLSRGIIIGFMLLVGLSPAIPGQESSATTPAADLPSAESILDRYVEVTGGREAYESRKSEVAHGKMEIAAAGISGELTSYARPGLQYVVIELTGVGKIEQGVKGDIAWENSILQGPRIKTGDELQATLRDATFNAPIHWREMYPTVETVGIEPINGEDAYRVLQTPVEGNAVTTYYSVKTGLALKSSMTMASQMGDIPVEAAMLEYKEFGGVLYPTRLNQNAAGQNITITIDSVEINEDIPDERFDLPEAVQALVK